MKPLPSTAFFFEVLAVFEFGNTLAVYIGAAGKLFLMVSFLLELFPVLPASTIRPAIDRSIRAESASLIFIQDKITPKIAL